MHHFSKWFARKKNTVCLVRIKNLLCNPEELVEHVKMCNSELSLYRDHFFFLLHHSKKWTLALSGNSAAMFGTFVYSLHNVPFVCVCYQLSLLLVNSCHGWPVDFRPIVVIVFLLSFLSIQAERRYNSKLYDMRDRLDQANSTTRSMQNYVSFLKSSYSNVFDELESPRWPTE